MDPIRCLTPLVLFPFLFSASCSGSGRGAGADSDAEAPADTVGEEASDAGPDPAPDPPDDGTDLPTEVGDPGPSCRPLSVNEANPRYLDDGSGRAVLLVGANHGWELMDDAWSREYTLDFSAFLDYLAGYNLNYVRRWRVESPQQTSDDTALAAPLPYERTGPGAANDGLGKFDLTRFDGAYFDRLRDRCIEAGERSITVAVMFFERHSTIDRGGDAWPWMGHPFHADNNVNGIDADVDGDGQGGEYFLMPSDGGSAEVLALQEAYVRRVIDALNDLDNVVYEICNEAKPGAHAWQVHMIDVARAHMETLGCQQLVGYTGPGRADDGTWPDFELQLSSTADFVSPRDNTAYRSNPPANDGRKVIFADSDHIDPYGRDAVWVYKSFTRGLHPQALEAYDIVPADPPRIDPARDELVRTAMGQCLAYAERMSLVGMLPRGGLSSSRYCLADPGSAYLVFVPDGGPVDVDLTPAASLHGEWLDVVTSTVYDAGTVAGGGMRTLAPPFAGHAVLYLWE
jgi:hypothetical protein